MHRIYKGISIHFQPDPILDRWIGEHERERIEDFWDLVDLVDQVRQERESIVRHNESIRQEYVPDTKAWQENAPGIDDDADALVSEPEPEPVGKREIEPYGSGDLESFFAA